MQKRIDPKLVIAAIAAIGLLCLNLGLAVTYSGIQRENDLRVVRAQQLLMSLERTLSYAKDAETGQRGFLITNDPEFLEPFTSAKTNIAAEMTGLESLMQESPTHLDALGEMRSTWEARLGFLEAGKAIRERPDSDIDVREFIRQRKGKDAMDRLRAQVAALETKLDQDLANRRAEASAAYQNTLATSIVSGLAGIIAVLACLGLLIRNIQARARDAAVIHEQREILQTTLVSIGDAVITTDEDAKVTFLNRVAEDLTGWSNQEAMGEDLQKVFNIVNEHTRGPVENPALRALREGVIVGLANHTILIGRQGGEVPIDDSAAPIRTSDGVIAGSVLIFRDISDRKKTEDDLRRIAADLSEADRRKDEFLATLAHELRNPLAPVLNAVELLKFRGRDEEVIDLSREVIERQVNHLTRLIDDLLDLSRITRNKIDLRFERVALADVISIAVEASRPLISQHMHEMVVAIPEEPVILRADSIRLAQIITNLLNNAAKYTPDGGRVELRAERIDARVEISVKDNGIGIPPEDQARLFEMFYQVDGSLERSRNGLGIGLALVRRLAELHGGSVVARSEGRDHGAEFIVALPVPDADAVETLSPENADDTLRGRRILIADDNEDILNTLSMLLRTLGNEVFTASDGHQALAAAQREHPDLIILDIGMPLRNGYEVCRELRTRPEFQSTTFIALTGWGQDEDRNRSKEAGFDAHLVKPIDRAALQRALHHLKPS